MYYLAYAVITKYHRLDGLNNTFISHDSKGYIIEDQSASQFSS